MLDLNCEQFAEEKDKRDFEEVNDFYCIEREKKIAKNNKSKNFCFVKYFFNFFFMFL